VCEVTEDVAEVIESPLDGLIQQQMFLRYRRALVSLRRRDRLLIVASIERDWTVDEIAVRLRMKSVAATRVAISRAMQRLSKLPAMSAGLTPSATASS
jgi:DNA-directed RNA polymerase specialized sigma24 family protein